MLCANPLVPIDIGNGCGMSLMNYRNKVWDDELLAATTQGLPGGAEELLAKLPELAAPDSVVGNIATYFVERYGFSEECSIIAGSGGQSAGESASCRRPPQPWHQFCQHGINRWRYT